MSKRALGFSLTEIMIVAALVSLLCAIALPAVTTYVDEARINRAVNDIGSASIRIYKWRATNGAFPETLAQAGIAMPTDPWGKPYVYRNVGTASEGEQPGNRSVGGANNTDFDLFSLGADGTTASGSLRGASRDDVVRANNGAYVGLAAEY